MSSRSSSFPVWNSLFYFPVFLPTVTWTTQQRSVCHFTWPQFELYSNVRLVLGSQQSSISESSCIFVITEFPFQREGYLCVFVKLPGYHEFLHFVSCCRVIVSSSFLKVYLVIVFMVVGNFLPGPRMYHSIVPQLAGLPG